MPSAPCRRSATRGGGCPWSAPTRTAKAREASVGCSCLVPRLDDEPHLVEVAPAPVLPRLGGANDRMTGLVRVRGRVPVRRRVAATDLAAAHAHAQMHPARADLQALLTTRDRLGERRDGDLVEMTARRGHRTNPPGRVRRTLLVAPSPRRADRLGQKAA